MSAPETNPVPSSPAASPASPRPKRWTLGRIFSVAGGILVVVLSVGLLAAGAGATYMGTAGRADGYVHLDSSAFHTNAYALVSTTVMSDEVGTTWGPVLSLFGTTRIRVTATDGSGPIFVGIAPREEAAAYLAGVEYETARDLTRTGITYFPHSGSAPADKPGQERFWTAQATGTGTQTVLAPAQGDWMLVVMNADGSRALSVTVAFDAAWPSLAWMGAALIVFGGLLLAAGAVLILVPVRRIRRS